MKCEKYEKGKIIFSVNKTKASCLYSIEPAVLRNYHAEIKSYYLKMTVQ